MAPLTICTNPIYAYSAEMDETKSAYPLLIPSYNITEGGTEKTFNNII